MAMRLRTQNDNVGGWLQKLQDAGRDKGDIELEQQLVNNTYGDQSNVPTFLGMPMQLNIGAMSGTSKKAGSKEKMTGLEDIGETASVDNVYYQKPDGNYAPIKEIAHPKDSKDAITPAKAVPLFVKQGDAFTPAKTFDSGGTNKDAVLVNAKGLDGDLGFQTATRDELPYFKPGNTDKSVIPDTIGEGWSNEMTVLTTDPAATLNGTSSAAAEARAARIGATRNKELPPLTYQGIDQEETKKAQLREQARVDELNARNAIKYEELISKYPERAPTEQNIKRNAEIRAANAKGDSGEVYHDTLNVPSFVNPVRGEAFLGGGRISGMLPQRQEVDLIEKPGEIKPNVIAPIVGPQKIQGTYVPRERPAGRPRIEDNQWTLFGFGDDNATFTTGSNKVVNNTTFTMDGLSRVLQNESARGTAATGLKAVEDQNFGGNLTRVGTVGGRNAAEYVYPDAKVTGGASDNIANIMPYMVYDVAKAMGQPDSFAMKDRAYTMLIGAGNSTDANLRNAVFNAIKNKYAIPNGINADNIGNWLQEQRQKRNKAIFDIRNKDVITNNSANRNAVSTVLENYWRTKTIMNTLSTER